MIAVDTNVLIRFFIHDDKRQSKLVTKLFSVQESNEEKIFISNIVLVELVWVLKKGYEIPKKEIIKTLQLLILNKIFMLEDRQIIKQTVKKYEQKSGDFADYLIGETGFKYHANTTFTFDKKSGKDNQFTILR